MWPQSTTVTRRAPGMRSTMRRDSSGGVVASSAPTITSVAPGCLRSLSTGSRSATPMTALLMPERRLRRSRRSHSSITGLFEASARNAGREYHWQHSFSQYPNARHPEDCAQQFEFSGALGTGAGVQERQRANQFRTTGVDALSDESPHRQSDEV